MDDATLVYDDDCGFCSWWARRLDEHAELELVGFSELSESLRERLPEDYEKCAHLVTEDAVYSCGESIEQAFVRSDLGKELRPVVAFAGQFDEYDSLRERAYRAVADRREKLGHFVSADPPGRSGSDEGG